MHGNFERLASSVSLRASRAVEHGRGYAAIEFSLGSDLAPSAELDKRYCSVFAGERSGGSNVRCKPPVERSADIFSAGRGFEK